MFVRKVTERHAREALNAQLAKSQRDALDLFSQQGDAIDELDTLMSGAKSSFSGGKMSHYANLLQTASALDNAAFNLENALLTNDFQAWSDYSDVEPVNIPKQFARARILEAPTKAALAGAAIDPSEVRMPCGF
jgi:hypothetical protein